MYKNLQLASTKSKSININLILHLRKRNLGDQYLKLKSYLNELGKKKLSKLVLRDEEQ